MKVRRTPLVAVAALLIAALGCPAASDAQQTSPLIRIASSAAETYAQASYAQELGLYAKAGLNVEVDVLGTGAAVSTAVAGGAADIGVATTLNLANAVTRGVPFVIIAPAAMETPKAASGLLCVAKSSTYKTAKDLDGTTIALSALKQTVDLGLREWLTQGGEDPAKVHIVETPFATMAAGLDRGTYAAAIISEPALSRALAAGSVRCIGDPFAAIAPTYMFAAWFTTRQFAQAHPDLVRKVAAALTDAGAWANTHHDESAAIVAKLNHVDLDTIRGEVRPVYADVLTAAEIQPQLDAGYTFGFLTRPVKADELLNR